MKKIIALLILIICLSVLALWLISDEPHRPDRTREEQYIHEVNLKQAEIKRLRALYDSISMKMYNDSLEFQARLKLKSDEIKRLKQNAAKVDFKNANPTTLDSVVERLYPRPRR